MRFSINKIAEAIRKAAEPLSLHEAAEFGGESSIAFRERLVREYNAEHVTHCPTCGSALVSTGSGEADCHHCKKTYSFPKEGAHLCYVSEEDSSSPLYARACTPLPSRYCRLASARSVSTSHTAAT